jgi:uncharacterized membrane protein YpjA
MDWKLIRSLLLVAVILAAVAGIGYGAYIEYWTDQCAKESRKHELFTPRSPEMQRACHAAGKDE